MANETNANQAAARQRWLRLGALALILVGLVAVGRAVDLGDNIDRLRAWIESLGAWGPAAYVVTYAVLVSIAVPAFPLTVLGGAIFGAVHGVVLVSVASTFGCALSMLGARYLARNYIASKFGDNKQLQWLNRVTERQGALAVALTRLVPVLPFNLINYGFGLTRVPFWTYLFWSWLCMLPTTVIYVAGTDAITQALADGRVPWTLVAVVAVMVLIVALLVRSARRKLNADA